MKHVTAPLFSQTQTTGERPTVLLETDGNPPAG
jgi:hypothetical protein